jgi:hypothetical protein
MIIQVFNRVDDVRDLCEKRCEQLRRLAVPVNRPVQRVHPLPTLQQNESLNLIGTTTSILHQQMNEHFPSSDIDHNLSSSSSSSNNINNNTVSNENNVTHNAKMDKKQRYERR